MMMMRNRRVRGLAPTAPMWRPRLGLPTALIVAVLIVMVLCTGCASTMRYLAQDAAMLSEHAAERAEALRGTPDALDAALYAAVAELVTEALTPAAVASEVAGPVAGALTGQELAGLASVAAAALGGSAWVVRDRRKYHEKGKGSCTT